MNEFPVSPSYALAVSLLLMALVIAGPKPAYGMQIDGYEVHTTQPQCTITDSRGIA